MTDRLFVLPPLPNAAWRDRGLCATHPTPWLWDAVHHEHEGRKSREHRHEAAKAICGRCPVRLECSLDVDPQHDEGIRGGRLLHGTRRDLRQEPCPDCGQPTTVNKMSRHRLTHRKSVHRDSACAG